MLKALIGKKLNMSQTFDSHGRVTPVTLIKIEPNFVIAIKDKEKDGYKAAQIGTGVAKKVSKPLSGHFEKAKLNQKPSLVREVDFDGEIKTGQEVKVDDVFHKGSMVDVVGTSKGKGFAGVIKRHGFAGGPKTHGQSDRHRAPGSIGATTTPGRVFKGLKMAGHMGNERVSIFGLEIVKIDKENNILIVKGSVPGASGNTVLIKKSKKKRAAYHEPEIQALPNLGSDEDKEKETSDSIEQGSENSNESKTDVKVENEEKPQENV